MITKRWFGLGGQMIFGLILSFFGVLLLLDNVDIIDVGWRFWPFIIVFLGLYKLLNAENGWRSGSGLWLIFLGLWLSVSVNHIFGLHFRDTWPILIIGWGVSILWRSLGYQSRYTLSEEHHGN